MAGVVGTVIDVQSLFCSEETKVKYSRGEVKDTPLVCLKKDREYIIPMYQREIRWEKGNLLTLINDIEDGAKFLGNIILSEDEEGNYEILDGQQRMTAILLLYKYMENLYGSRLPMFQLCDFKIKSFEGFNELLSNCFDKSKLSESDMKRISASDDYQQMQKYFSLWQAISSYEGLQKVAEVESFLRKLSQCDINVIINKDNRENSIARFLDVNLKGVKLDTEDIFKSYLYAQDSSIEVHELWSILKKKDALLKDMKKGLYPLMMFVEHYFRCVLPQNERYREIHFNSEFEILEDTIVEKRSYIAGTHVLTMLKDKEYVKKCLVEMNEILDIILDIIGSEGVGSLLKSCFTEFNKRQKKDKKRLDDDEMVTIHNLAKKVLLDKDKVPKCVLVKYLLDAIIWKAEDKKTFLKIYTVSTFSLVFSLFQPRKDIIVVEPMLKEEVLGKAVCDYIKNRLNSHNSSNRQIIAAYRFNQLGSDIDENLSQQYRCKTLATIYEFFSLGEESVSLKSGKIKKLIEFLNNDAKYSVEHFIVNESGTCEIEIANKKQFTYNYPDNVKKMKDSLFNYIFISQDNNNALGNRLLSYKLEIIETTLKEAFDVEDCEYTKLTLNAIKAYFHMPDVKMMDSENEAKKALDLYFLEQFGEEYMQFSNYLIKKAI